MTDAPWRFDASAGELLLHTGVTGRAAKMGHRLTIAMTDWEATVVWTDGHPATAALTVAVDSLQVLRGEGGVTPLSTPEKTLIRSNALKCLRADRYPTIRFEAEDVITAGDGYRLAGPLTICGRTRRHELDVHLDEADDPSRLHSETEVRHSDYEIKAYSLLMGTLKVADPVALTFTAVRRR